MHVMCKIPDLIVKGEAGLGLEAFLTLYARDASNYTQLIFEEFVGVEFELRVS